MISPKCSAVIASACALVLVSAAQAQPRGAGPCRQGVLALIVMIEADEHDKSHYRSTAASVVETCGPPGAPPKPASSPVPFDKAACGKLALAMLDTMEGSNMGSPPFVQARDEFAGRCLGK